MFLKGSDFRPVYSDNIDRVGRISFFCGALRPGSTFFRAVRAYLSPVFAIVSLEIGPTPNDGRETRS